MTEVEDELGIADDEILLRRVKRDKPDMFKTDSATGLQRPSSAAFIVHDDGISVYRNLILNNLGLIPQTILAPTEIVVSLTATHVRECDGLEVKSDPWPRGIQDDHPEDAAHALIIGWRDLPRNRQKNHQRHLARSCVVLDT